MISSTCDKLECTESMWFRLGRLTCLRWRNLSPWEWSDSDWAKVLYQYDLLISFAFLASDSMLYKAIDEHSELSCSCFVHHDEWSQVDAFAIWQGYYESLYLCTWLFSAKHERHVKSSSCRPCAWHIQPEYLVLLQGIRQLQSPANRRVNSTPTWHMPVHNK